MRYEYEDCELVHIRDIAGGISGGIDTCLKEMLGFNIIRLGDVGNGSADMNGNRIENSTANSNGNSSVNQTLESGSNDDNKSFEGVHVIFIGDSVMKLEMGFFSKLVHGSFGIKISFIETNGGIHLTMRNVTSTLKEIQQREQGANVKRVILFNTGLHDIDVLCCSKRQHARDKTNITSKGESCSDAYREAMVQLVHVLDDFPAELKVFRSTTAGKIKVYGYYVFINHNCLPHTN